MPALSIAAPMTTSIQRVIDMFYNVHASGRIASLSLSDQRTIYRAYIEAAETRVIGWQEDYEESRNMQPLSEVALIAANSETVPRDDTHLDFKLRDLWRTRAVNALIQLVDADLHLFDNFSARRVGLLDFQDLTGTPWSGEDPGLGAESDQDDESDSSGFASDFESDQDEEPDNSSDEVFFISW